ncbi:hypothetical protein [Granulicella sp. S156]|jgi:hypothetical protein|uniref:hypothetical protein n=1 Tax=Granulicella sp. S156 TaxID=1747224 RepID=UPI00131C63CA|nr:hypothetical protein [Granulicella sp. S156]
MNEHILLRRKSFAPLVIQRDGALLYYLPVESGHMSLSFEFPISREHYQVLSEDEERYYFLFSALHHPFQLAQTRLSAGEVTGYFSLILLDDKAEVETFLTQKDRESNGAISNLVQIFFGRNASDMREGKWFCQA